MDAFKKASDVLNRKKIERDDDLRALAGRNETCRQAIWARSAKKLERDADLRALAGRYETCRQIIWARYAKDRLIYTEAVRALKEAEAR